MKTENKVIALSIFLGLLVGLLDSLIDYFLFYEKPFWDLLIFDVPLFEIYIRAIILVIFLVFGIIVSRMMAKRIQAEEKIRQQSEFLNSVLESLTHPFYVVDVQDYSIKIANAAAHQGRLAKDSTCYALTHNSDRPCLSTEHPCPVEIIKKTKQPVTVEHIHYDKDGNPIQVEVHGYPIFDADGNVSQIIEYSLDVTDRKQAEEALRESEEKNRTVLEANPDPVVVYDTEGKVFYLNPAFTRVFGWSSKERFGKKMDVFVPDEAWPETKMMIDKVLAGKAFSGIETHRYTKEGKLIPVSISGATYRDLEGNHVGTVVNLRDISEQKRLDAQLQQAQKLEAIGILAGGLAHDFNNLLAIIIGNIDLAKDDIKPEVGISENLTEVEKASLRAKELIKQLITFSKGGEPVKEVGSIGDLVKDTTNLTISGSNARCEFSLPKDLWFIEFDEGQMKHAIKNLIENAIESMQDGGSINVQAENLEIDSETAEPISPFSEGKYIKIAIRDHGVGIPEEHLSKVFDPYFSTKEMGVQKGMGMGLATTYSIINRHHGHITVESEAGIGTTFTLYLPAHEKDIRKLKPVETPEPEKPGVSTGRILVMDDEEMIRNLSKQMLNRLGYEPKVAKDGVEAIELYRDAKDSGKPFDAVILDLTIKGGLGGKDTIKAMLEIDPQVKTIVSSGYSNDPVMTHFRDHGFIGALSKPYIMKDLGDMLNQVLGKS